MSFLKDPSDPANSLDSTSSYTMMYSKSGMLSQMATLTAQPPQLHFDFLSFLGIAQKLQVRFLPLVWQPALDGLDILAGVGGTAELRQSVIRFEESFVFKLIKPVERAKWSEHKIFQMLVSEIIVLTHPRVKYHPNVLPLQGICWDVTFEEKAWPVLVFEKAQFGNLGEFAMGKGKGMSFQDRRKLCADIGTAMRDFHACQIIHGDIKPQNVLIFKTEKGGYIAKVTDFGYSTMYAGNGLIEMPYSKIWTAPEWGQRGGYKFSEAQKMDSYSFGLLCLWLLFYAPLLNGDSRFCNELRLGTRKTVLAEQFIAEISELGVHERNQFRRFFELTLADNPAERGSDFVLFLELLKSHSSPFPHHLESFLVDSPITPPPDFQLFPSIFDLCRTHHGVRAYITECLKQRASRSSLTSSQHAAYELAICYKLGFGVERDNDRSEWFLKQTKRFKIQLEHEITILKLMREKPVPRGGLYNESRHSGLLPFASSVEQYLNLGQMIDIVPRLTKEVIDTEATLGAEHEVPLILKSALCQVLRELEEWDKVEVLQTQVMEANLATRGQKHPETLGSIRQLALIFYGQKRWKDAEKLQTQLMSLNSTFRDRSDVIDWRENLALTYCAQERWKEAEELQLHAVKERQKLLGPDHSRTLNSMSLLGQIYRDQGRFIDAEEVFTKQMEIKKRVLGSQHPDILACVIIIGHILDKQRRWKEAEELYIQMMQAQLESSGPEHPHNLKMMIHLGLLYRGQGRLREAEKLHMQVMEVRERELGPEDRETLNAFTILAKTYEAQNRWREAEDLLMQVVKMNEEMLGMKCLKTMESMSNLAGNYEGQKEWAKAEEVQITVVQTSISILGQKNPRTLIHMHNLACVLFHQERWIDAEKLQMQVIEISVEALGPDHSQTSNSTGWLALIYRKQDRWKEAETLLTQVLEKTKTCIGCGNSNELHRCLNMSHLASLYLKQERWEEAEKLLVEVVDRYLVIHGQEHKSTLNGMSTLAFMYGKQKRWKEAEDWALQVLAISKKWLGPEHPDTLKIMFRLATIYNGRGKLNGIPLEVEVTIPTTNSMVIEEEHSAPAHRMAGQDPNWTAQRYREKGLDLLSQVVETSKRVLGSDHHSTMARIKFLDEWANISQTASPPSTHDDLAFSK